MAILVGLASFRLANLLVNEDGPFEIFERARAVIGLKPGEVSGFLPSLFSCIYCMSVWTTMLMWLVWQIEPVIVAIIAGMTVALIADRATRG